MEIINKNELLKTIEELFNQDKFQEITLLLNDKMLSEQNDAEFYSWRARVNDRLNNDIDITLLFADKAIKSDPYQFMGYFARACAWDAKKEKDKAIENYTKAIELNPDFADAYYNRGLVLQSKKEQQKATIDFENAIINYSNTLKINPHSPRLYVCRGNTWYCNGNYDKAIEDYTTALNINNSADAHYNRGLAWFAKLDYTKAIEDFTQAITLKSDYSDVYNTAIGNAWFAAKKYNKAIANYSEAININETFENAYYSRGLAKKENDNDLQDCIKDFQKYLELTIDKNEIWAKYARRYIDDLNEKIIDPDLSYIRQQVNNIKDKLLIEDECIHYTSLSTLKRLILEDSQFRISEGNFMNDPSEGNKLFEYLEYKSDNHYNNGSIVEYFSSKPFIGSFVNKEKHDDLNMWRFYGKEDGKEAKGCAITLSMESLIVSINNCLTDEKKEARQDNESDISFYRIVYWTKGENTFYIPDSTQNTEFEVLMRELKTKVSSYLDNGKNKIALGRYLNSIAFLFKTDDYKYENEMRLIVKGIEFEKKYDMNTIPPRVYIELGPIKKFIKRVTLGPKVDEANKWASAIYHKYETNPPEIIISHLPYQ